MEGINAWEGIMIKLQNNPNRTECETKTNQIMELLLKTTPQFPITLRINASSLQKSTQPV